MCPCKHTQFFPQLTKLGKPEKIPKSKTGRQQQHNGVQLTQKDPRLLTKATLNKCWIRLLNMYLTESLLVLTNMQICVEAQKTSTTHTCKQSAGLNRCTTDTLHPHAHTYNGLSPSLTSWLCVASASFSVGIMTCQVVILASASKPKPSTLLQRQTHTASEYKPAGRRPEGAHHRES